MNCGSIVEHGKVAHDFPDLQSKRYNLRVLIIK